MLNYFIQILFNGANNLIIFLQAAKKNAERVTPFQEQEDNIETIIERLDVVNATETIEGDKKRHTDMENLSQNKKRFKKQNGHENDFGKFDKALESLLSVGSNELQIENCEYKSFGQSVGIQLSKLPEIYSAEAMCKIQQLLTECKLKAIQNRQVSTSVEQNSSSRSSSSLYGKLATNNSSSSQIFLPISPTDSPLSFNSFSDHFQSSSSADTETSKNSCGKIPLVTSNLKIISGSKPKFKFVMPKHFVQSAATPKLTNGS